jgi:predicted metal-dependent peptidase
VLSAFPGGAPGGLFAFILLELFGRTAGKTIRKELSPMFKLPRLLWRRKPCTQAVPNKKAVRSKYACRKSRQKDYYERKERFS